MNATSLILAALSQKGEQKLADLSRDLGIPYKTVKWAAGVLRAKNLAHPVGSVKEGKTRSYLWSLKRGDEEDNGPPTTQRIVRRSCAWNEVPFPKWWEV